MITNALQFGETISSASVLLFFYQLPTSGLSDHIQKNIEIDFQIYAFLEFFEMSGTMYINY